MWHRSGAVKKLVEHLFVGLLPTILLIAAVIAPLLDVLLRIEAGPSQRLRYRDELLHAHYLLRWSFPLQSGNRFNQVHAQRVKKLLIILFLRGFCSRSREKIICCSLVAHLYWQRLHLETLVRFQLCNVYLIGRSSDLVIIFTHGIVVVSCCSLCIGLSKA